MQTPKEIPIKRLADGHMSMLMVHEYPAVHEIESDMYILASCLKRGKCRLIKPSDDSDEDTAGMESIQDILDNF